MAICFLPYDATSSKKSSAAACRYFYQQYNKYFESQTTLIDINDVAPSMLDQFLLNLFKLEQPKVLVGGEHLLTYYSYLYVKEIVSPKKLKLIIFDAHHDAYQKQNLSHYSFVDWLIEKYNVEVLIIGVRHEPEKANPAVEILPYHASTDMIKHSIKNFLGDDLFYLSVDVDAVNPCDFPYSAFPVSQGLGIYKFEMLFDFCLQLKPQFVDFVEFDFRHTKLDEEIVSRSLNWVKRGSVALALPD